MNEIWILPTKIVDRFGNSVTYTYDPARPANLKRIESSDGRVLNINYIRDGNGIDTNRIASVSDGTGTWTYNYGSGLPIDLNQVVLPDGSSWQLNNVYSLLADLQYPSEPPACVEHVKPYMTVLTGSMTHPGGATGTFTLTPSEHGRSDVQKWCVDKHFYTPIFYYTNSLTRKSITGPGFSEMAWTYQYGPGNGSFSPCNNCVTSTYIDVTDPEGDVVRYTYGNRYVVSEGKLEQIDAGWNGSSALRTTRIEYRAVGAGPYLDQDGTSDELLGDSGADLRNRPEEARTITQQGVNFSWRATEFDTLARPTRITRSSTLGFARSDATLYEDNGAKWVLGQVKQVTNIDTGKVGALNIYDPATANLLSVSQFGKLQRTMSYNGDGTLRTVADGKNNTTTFNNYMRGTPRQIMYQDGSSESAIVNNIGKIDSITNAAGYTTSFGYDAIGRLASITYPSADAVAWNPTSISLGPVGEQEYDLAPGHWKQVVTTGTGTEVSYLDALWRPVYVERYDSADVASTSRIVKHQYDSAGQATFESYPQRSYQGIAGGVHSDYDALGRTETRWTDSELGSLYEYFGYIGSFQKSHTDPKGNVTYYSFQAFDQPAEDAMTGIALPEGVAVNIARDIFGKTQSITRSGAGLSLTRSYVYDTYERLCKTIEPETGATVQDYDAASNVSWRASGLVLLSASTCDTTNVPAAKKTNFYYDVLNRLTDTTFGDGSFSINRTYTPDGLPDTVSSHVTRWTYRYNKRRLLEGENMWYAGSTYDVGRTYDVNGSPATLRYPDNLTLAYNPNALGEPRQVGGYATGVTYHPNGAIAGFTYGNGIQHTMLQNLRGLPDLVTDTGVLSDKYFHDKNANVEGILDYLHGVSSRGMSYDGLNRLKTVTAPNLWGTATYGYDSLDNLVSTSITGGQNARNVAHNIDYSTNRLASITNGPVNFNFAYGYDGQGNITSRGGQTYQFDLANRMTAAPGRATYDYDGLGRRVSVVGTDGVNRLQFYSQAGQLLYVAQSSGPATKYIYLRNHQIAEVK